MKKIKLLSCILVAVLMIGVMAISAFASPSENTEEAVVVTITTDKEEYLSGEEIQARVTIENKNPFPIRNVVVKEIVSGGFALEGGACNQTLSGLDAQKTTCATYTLGIARSDDTIVRDILIAIGLTVVLLVVAAAVMAFLKKKKGRRFLLFALSLAILVIALPTLPIGASEEDGLKNYSEIVIVEIKVDGKTAALQAEVEYAVAESDLN